jgi:phosphatidylinositol alpha-mannosyltransferase
MRIALLHPTFWPEVLRGSERVVHGLGATLASRGHDVTLITGHPARPTVQVEDGIRVVRKWRPPQPPTLGLHEQHLGHVPNVVCALARGRFELAHAFFLTDAWAAVQARRFGGPPVAFSFHGIPTREYLVMRRYRLEMMQRAVEGAAACVVLSEAAADPFRRYLLREPHVVPPGLFADRFATDAARAENPTLICAASLGDPRKRAALLFSAFRRLRSLRPGVRLLVVRGRDPFMSPEPVELPPGAEWLEVDQRPEALGRAYGSAWAGVLPAVDEAFGLVITESLAAGTPAVAARSGAGPEVIDDEAIGRLFEPDDEPGLVRAMDEALELGSRPETRAACRARAADYDWSRLIERYERLYGEVLEGDPDAPGREAAARTP